jgi:hypothetical protein
MSHTQTDLSKRLAERLADIERTSYSVDVFTHLEPIHAALVAVVEAAEESCKCTYRQVVEDTWTVRTVLDEECVMCVAIERLTKELTE